MKAQIQQLLGGKSMGLVGSREKKVNQVLSIGFPVSLSKKTRESFSRVLWPHHHRAVLPKVTDEPHSISFCKDVDNEGTECISAQLLSMKNQQV